MWLLNPYVFGGVLWTPANITTALWLDAADAGTVTTVSGAVSQWNDKSGNSRHVSQSTLANRPTLAANSLNGLPGIDWGGTINGRFLSRSLSAYPPSSYYGVANYDGTNPFDEYSGLISHDFSNNSDLFVTSNAGLIWFGGNQVFHNGAATSTATALPTISSPFIFATNFAATANRTQLFIGSDRGTATTTRGWRGLIHEIIAIPSILDLSGRRLVEGYLAHKWGLVANLPSDHPFKNAPPAI